MLFLYIAGLALDNRRSYSLYIPFFSLLPFPSVIISVFGHTHKILFLKSVTGCLIQLGYTVFH